MIRINLLPREERQTRRSFTMPKMGAIVPVLALIGVVALFAAFSVIQTLQVGRLKTDIARAHAIARKHRALNMGLVDAVVMAIAERLRADAIATLDLRHVGAIKIAGAPRLLPRDAE